MFFIRLVQLFKCGHDCGCFAPFFPQDPKRIETVFQRILQCSIEAAAQDIYVTYRPVSRIGIEGVVQQWPQCDFVDVERIVAGVVWHWIVCGWFWWVTSVTVKMGGFRRVLKEVVGG